MVHRQFMVQRKIAQCNLTRRDRQFNLTWIWTVWQHILNLRPQTPLHPEIGSLKNCQNFGQVESIGPCFHSIVKRLYSDWKILLAKTLFEIQYLTRVSNRFLRLAYRSLSMYFVTYLKHLHCFRSISHFTFTTLWI